jgi:hypothetical protein
MDPVACLGVVEKRESISSAGNQTPIVHPLVNRFID